MKNMAEQSTTSAKQSTTSAEQLTTSAKQSATSAKQPPTSAKQSATSAKQPTTSAKQSATSAKQSATSAKQPPTTNDQNNTQGYKRETARLEKKKLPLMTQEDIEYVRRAVYRIGKVLDNIMTDNRFSGKDMADILSEYVADENTISRYINHAEKRRISADFLIALRRVFGISLDALADGNTPFGKDFPPELHRQLVAWLLGENGN